MFDNRKATEDPATENPTKFDVLVSFTDDKDGNKVYWAGKDTYPRDGYEPDAARVAYLQSSATKFKKPVISGGDKK